MTSHSARPRGQPPRRSRASTENQLSQEDGLYASRSVAHEHEHGLVGPALDIDIIDKEERQQQKVEADEKTMRMTDRSRWRMVWQRR